MEHTDHHVGRVIDAIKDLGVYDDTLVCVIICDNGASAEGTLQGAFNEMANLNGMGALETPELMASKLDELGSPTAYNHYAVGWAWAMDTPWSSHTQVGGLGKGGTVTLHHDGTAVGTGTLPFTQAMIFSADETTDVGYESGTTVSPDLTSATSRFRGTIGWVQIDVGKDDHDHMIDPEERLRVVMARRLPPLLGPWGGPSMSTSAAADSMDAAPATSQDRRGHALPARRGDHRGRGCRGGHRRRAGATPIVARMCDGQRGTEQEPR